MNRLLIALLALVVSSGFAIAQSPANYGFNEFIYPGGNGPCGVQTEFCETSNLAPFQTCGIQNSAWYASHGTPEVVFFDDGFWASIWAGKYRTETKYGEGLFLACDYFEEGKSYTVSFRLKTCGTLDKVSIDLVHSGQLIAMPQLFTVQSPEYDIPVLTNEQNIFKRQNINISSPTIFQISFTPTDDYPYLYIWIEDEAEEMDMLFIDYFYFEDCANVDSEITYVSDEMPDNKYSLDWIKLETNAYVEEGRTVELVAGDYIELNTETTIDFDAEFEAYISPCMNGSELDCGINDAFPDLIEKRGGKFFGFDEIGEAAMARLAILHPNPSTGFAQLSFVNVFTGTVELLSMTGELLFKTDLVNVNYYVLNTGILPKGTYLVKMDTNKTVVYEKLVVY